MQINRLDVSNFRCFAQYNLELASRFTLLIGDNGSGKTAILDALAVAMGGFHLGIPDMPARHIQKDEIRRQDLVVGETITQELAGEVSVIARGKLRNQEVEWKRSLTGPYGRTTRVHADEIKRLAGNMARKVKANESVVLPVLSYYGTGRLWRTLKKGTKTIGKQSRFAGYDECLNPASDQKRLFRWFKANELAALQKRQRRQVLEAVRDAIVGMIPKAEKVYWDLDWDELMIKTKILGEQAQSVPFHLLSDGYRNMVGVAADIAYRMAVLNPQLEKEAIRETPGIVLIDELDLHLHPNWQREVVPCMLKVFPRVQFVGTTHSPFVIQALHGQPNALLWDLAKQQRLAVETKSIEDIAEVKQGVDVPQQSKRFLEMMDVAKQYYGLLRQGNANGADTERLRKKLDELSMPYSDDPAFQALLQMERAAAGVDST
ncbi:MAG: AAA family ATPase [Gemmataceae bacterium]|nr:AAA family ATPase [Gemmataceae bacterium]MCI0738362.1 AAA family ATPase [Gemmataceae bacterium]